MFINYQASQCEASNLSSSHNPHRTVALNKLILSFNLPSLLNHAVEGRWSVSLTKKKLSYFDLRWRIVYGTVPTQQVVECM